MPQCQLRVFCYILGIGRNENPASYFPDTYTESKGEKEGSHKAATPCGGAGPPLAAPRHGVGPTGASDHRTSAYLYPPNAKTLKTWIIFHEKFRRAATIET